MAEKPEAVAEQPRVLSEYITSNQLAAELGISLETLRRWESKRIGPPRVKIGSTILFRIGAVQEWLLGQETLPAGPRRRK